MSSTEEALITISKLQRSSRVAIPLSLAAILSIVGMLWLSGSELAERRAEIAAANSELDQKRQELEKVKQETSRLLAQTEERLSKADQQIEAASRTQTTQEREITLATARQELAFADAVLNTTRTGIVGTARGPDTALRFGTINIDIFYCQATSSVTKPLADTVARLKENELGRWRVRPLSETVNASPGYRVSDNVIRHNEDELSIARNLADDAKAKLGVHFRLQQVSYSTPGYLSAFICGTR